MELVEIEQIPDSIIYSPDATGPAPAALATPASPSPATAAILSYSYVYPADCARLVQNSLLGETPRSRLEEREAAVEQWESSHQP